MINQLILRVAGSRVFILGIRRVTPMKAYKGDRLCYLSPPPSSIAFHSSPLPQARLFREHRVHSHQLVLTPTMRLSTTTVLLQAALLAGLAVGEGINCEGDGYECRKHKGTINVLQDQIGNLTNIYSINDDFPIPNGLHIACANDLCAFLQKVVDSNNQPTTLPLGQVKVHLQNLIDHGCQACGSDPTQPGNDVNKGMLTVNYVSDVNNGWVNFGTPKTWNNSALVGGSIPVVRRHARSFDQWSE